jgi:hypothetical protein
VFLEMFSSSGALMFPLENRPKQLKNAMTVDRRMILMKNQTVQALSQKSLRKVKMKSHRISSSF